MKSFRRENLWTRRQFCALCVSTAAAPLWTQKTDAAAYPNADSKAGSNAPFDLRLVPLTAARNDSSVLDRFFSLDAERSTRTVLLVPDSVRKEDRFLRTTLARAAERNLPILFRSEPVRPFFASDDPRLKTVKNRPNELLELDAGGRVRAALLFDRSLGRWTFYAEPCFGAPKISSRSLRLGFARQIDAALVES